MRKSAATLFVMGLTAVAFSGQATAESTTELPVMVEYGTLAPPDQAGDAYTYDHATAPAGAALTVVAYEPDATSTRVVLAVAGLLPDRGYAVHAHTKPCGPTGADAGPHYQHVPDPAATQDRPSADPAYANPRNEIWLDLRTDDHGQGVSWTSVPFRFAGRAPASLVVHENPSTATHSGYAGTAGDRVACMSVDLT